MKKNTPSNYALLHQGNESKTLPTLGMLLAYLNSDDAPARILNDDLAVRLPSGEVLPVLARQGQSQRGIPLTGNSVEWLRSMMAEQKAHVFDPQRRQVWQMLPLEWASFQAISHLAYGVYPGLVRCGSEEWTTVDRLFHDHLGYHHNGPAYHRGEVNGRHDVHVAYALAANLDIPVQVLQEYEQLAREGEVWKLDCRWAHQLLAKPWLRGQIDVEHLADLTSLLRNPLFKHKEITPENLPFFKRCCAGTRNLVEFVNALDAQGCFEDQPLVIATDHSDSTGKDPAAIAIRTAIVAELQRSDSLRLEKMIATGHLSNPMIRREKQQIEALSKTTPWDWPQKVAQAYQRKDFALLSQVLDTAEGDNRGSKKALEKLSGLKFCGVKATERKANVYKLCDLPVPA